MQPPVSDHYPQVDTHNGAKRGRSRSERVSLVIQPVGLADIRQSCHASPEHFTGNSLAESGRGFAFSELFFLFPVFFCSTSGVLKRLIKRGNCGQCAYAEEKESEAHRVDFFFLQFRCLWKLFFGLVSYPDGTVFMQLRIIKKPQEHCGFFQ